MSQANVYTSAANAVWYTDKASISTGTNPVTYNVYAVGLVTPYGNGMSYTSTPVGNIYSNAVQIPANSTEYIYVGVGNKLTVTGGNVTIAECGTASSATAGVIGTP